MKWIGILIILLFSTSIIADCFQYQAWLDDASRFGSTPTIERINRMRKHFRCRPTEANTHTTSRKGNAVSVGEEIPGGEDAGWLQSKEDYIRKRATSRKKRIREYRREAVSTSNKHKNLDKDRINRLASESKPAPKAKSSIVYTPPIVTALPRAPIKEQREPTSLFNVSIEALGQFVSNWRPTLNADEHRMLIDQVSINQVEKVDAAFQQFYSKPLQDMWNNISELQRSSLNQLTGRRGVTIDGGTITFRKQHK